MMVLFRFVSLAVTPLAVAALFAIAPAKAQTTQPGAQAAFAIGSRVGLTLPAGFRPSLKFPGFEDTAAGASVLILDIPGPAYPQVEKQISAAALKAQNMIEEKRETVTLPYGLGVLVSGRQEGDGKKFRKWLFLVNLGDTAAMIAVQEPDVPKLAYADPVVRAMLRTVTSRTAIPIDEQLALLPIQFNDYAGMRPVRIAGNNNGVFLTDGPADDLEPGKQPVLVVSVGLNPPAETEARGNFARNMFGGMADMKDVKITGGEMLRIPANQQTHELQAEAVDVKTGTPVKIVQWVRFGGNAFVRMVGIAKADGWADSFNKFRAVRDGVNPRGVQ